MDTLKRARGEAVTLAIDHLPAGIRKNTIVNEKKIAVRQFNEIGF